MLFSGLGLLHFRSFSRSVLELLIENLKILVFRQKNSNIPSTLESFCQERNIGSHHLNSNLGIESADTSQDAKDNHNSNDNETNSIITTIMATFLSIGLICFGGKIQEGMLGSTTATTTMEAPSCCGGEQQQSFHNDCSGRKPCLSSFRQHLGLSDLNIVALLLGWVCIKSLNE